MTIDEVALQILEENRAWRETAGRQIERLLAGQEDMNRRQREAGETAAVAHAQLRSDLVNLSGSQAHLATRVDTLERERLLAKPLDDQQTKQLTALAEAVERSNQLILRGRTGLATLRLVGWALGVAVAFGTAVLALVAALNAAFHR